MGIGRGPRLARPVAKNRYDSEISDDEVRAILAAGDRRAPGEPLQKPLTIDGGKKPFVILVAGVNGTGKTTTIGKLARRLAREGKKVMLAAGDTFRAAAIEQLGVWAERAGPSFVAESRAATRRDWPLRRWRKREPRAPTFFSSIPRGGCRTRPT